MLDDVDVSKSIGFRHHFWIKLFLNFVCSIIPNITAQVLNFIIQMYLMFYKSIYLINYSIAVLFFEIIMVDWAVESKAGNDVRMNESVAMSRIIF